MKLLFVDTETTGFTGRIAQLAWSLVTYIDADNYYNVDQSYYIKPDGWHCSAFNKAHGITTDKCEALGIPIVKALELFLEDLAQAKVIIAHNYAFDKGFIVMEIQKSGLKILKHAKHEFCTMKFAKEKEMPYNLRDLHQYLGLGVFTPHEAGADVKAVRCITMELMKRKLIRP